MRYPTGESRIEPPQLMRKMNRLPICFMISFLGICGGQTVKNTGCLRTHNTHSDLAGLAQRPREITRLLDRCRDELLKQRDLDRLRERMGE